MAKVLVLVKGLVGILLASLAWALFLAQRLVSAASSLDAAPEGPGRSANRGGRAR